MDIKTPLGFSELDSDGIVFDAIEIGDLFHGLAWLGPNDRSGLNVSAGSVQAQPVLWPAELVGVAQPAIARLRAPAVCIPGKSAGVPYCNVFSSLQ